MAPSRRSFIARRPQVHQEHPSRPDGEAVADAPSPVRLIEDICILDHLTGDGSSKGLDAEPSPSSTTGSAATGPTPVTRFVDSLGLNPARAEHRRDLKRGRDRFYDFPTMPLSTKPYQERIRFWYPGSPFTAGRHGMSRCGRARSGGGLRGLPRSLALE